jgi:uncharacterized membrane protein
LGSPDFAHYKVPAALDPDLWTVEEEREGFFRASLQATLRSAHRDAFVSLRVERSMELLDPFMMAGNAGGVGLVTSTTMEILDGTPVAFLASNEASFITGSAYDIDGGFTLLR